MMLNVTGAMISTAHECFIPDARKLDPTDFSRANTRMKNELHRII